MSGSRSRASTGRRSRYTTGRGPVVAHGRVGKLIADVEELHTQHLQRKSKHRQAVRYLQDSDMRKSMRRANPMQYEKHMNEFEKRKKLREWFDFLDRDCNSEIDVEELEDPLTSMGLTRSRHDIEELIKTVDVDSSGMIGFEEFVEVVNASNKNPLKVLYQRTKHADVSKRRGSEVATTTDLTSELMLPTLLAAHRRKLVLDGLFVYRGGERSAEDEAKRTAMLSLSEIQGRTRVRRLSKSRAASRKAARTARTARTAVSLARSTRSESSIITPRTGSVVKRAVKADLARSRATDGRFAKRDSHIADYDVFAYRATNKPQSAVIARALPAGIVPPRSPPLDIRASLTISAPGESFMSGVSLDGDPLGPSKEPVPALTLGSLSLGKPSIELDAGEGKDDSKKSLSEAKKSGSKLNLLSPPKAPIPPGSPQRTIMVPTYDVGQKLPKHVPVVVPTPKPATPPTLMRYQSKKTIVPEPEPEPDVFTPPPLSRTGTKRLEVGEVETEVFVGASPPPLSPLQRKNQYDHFNFMSLKPRTRTQIAKKHEEDWRLAGVGMSSGKWGYVPEDQVRAPPAERVGQPKRLPSMKALPITEQPEAAPGPDHAHGGGAPSK